MMKKNTPGIRRPYSDHAAQSVQRSYPTQATRTSSNPNIRSSDRSQKNRVYSYPQRVNGNNSATMRPDPRRNPNNRKRRKKGTARRAAVRVFMILLLVVLLMGAGIFCVKEYFLNQMTFVTGAESATMKNQDGSIVSLTDISAEPTGNSLPAVDGIHNILLIGTDSRSRSYSDDGTGSLSDVIMILTVNENDYSLKFTAIQRDCFVYIPGYDDPQKINAAMSYGGPDLLMMVIENHLRIDLEQYAYVDLNHMEQVIDAVGGVTVNVSEDERTNVLGGLNELVVEQNREFGTSSDSHMLYETGDVTLDGRQAVAYARIRHVGNGDYDRSKRQMEVMQSLLSRYSTMGVTKKASVLAKVLSLISTNIPKADIENYALKFLPNMKAAKFDYMQIPAAGYSNEGMYYDFKSKGEWSIRPNWNGLIPLVQNYMFGQTFSFDPVRKIPEAPTATPTPAPESDDTAQGGA